MRSPVRSRLSAQIGCKRYTTQVRQAFSPTRIAILAFTLLYASAFYLWFVVHGNPEFILYLAEFFAFVVLACVLLARAPEFPDYILLLLSIVGLLHVAGGGVDLEGVRLYSYHLVTLYDGHQPDFYIFKYDQLVHLLGFGTGALAIRWIIKHHAPEFSALSQGALAILAAAGVGALNEVSEFSAVVSFSRTGVGGYYNIALDLTFNIIGALLAVLIVESLSRLKRRAK